MSPLKKSCVVIVSVFVLFQAFFYFYFLSTVFSQDEKKKEPKITRFCSYKKNLLFWINKANHALVQQQQMPWDESILNIKFSEAVNSFKIFNPYANNVVHLILGVNFLGRVEDMYFFKNVIDLKNSLIKINNILSIAFLQDNVLGQGVFTTIQREPFFFAVTNKKSSKYKGHWIDKYCYSNAYYDESKVRKILVIEAAENNIEEIKIFDSLFTKGKLQIINYLDKIPLSQNLKMSYFLRIFGPAIHYNIFADNQISFIYCDEKVCEHRVQRVAFVVNFNKDLIASSIIMIQKDLCEKCMFQEKKIKYLFDKQRTPQMVRNVKEIFKFDGSLDSFFSKFSYKKWFTELEKIKPIIETSPKYISKSQSLDILHKTYGSIGEKKFPIDVYINLIIRFSGKKEKLLKSELEAILLCHKPYSNKSLLHRGLKLIK